LVWTELAHLNSYEHGNEPQGPVRGRGTAPPA